MSEHDPQVPGQQPPETPPAQPAQPAEPAQPAQPAWTPEGPSGPRASFGRRFVALLVDTVVLLVAFFVIFGIASAIDEALGVIALFVLIIGIFAYYIVLEGGPTGQTLGKRALGIRVIDQNTGTPIGYGRGAIRLIARYLSQLPCYLGYFWMLWDKEKQTWHDKLSTSVVVPVQYYPVTR
jgi:uncharacterized RDD family membrane protein YckC